MNRIESQAGRVYCVDLAKQRFQVNVFSAQGLRVREMTLSRARFEAWFTPQRSGDALVVMEACGSSHHWARVLQSRGYRVKLVPPQFVAKQRIGNKTDGNDADGIFAVHRDVRVRAVPVKTLAQQDLGAVHRMRDLLMRQRTACINQLRGLLAERGCVAIRGQGGARALMARLEAPPSGEITPTLIALLHQIKTQIQDLEARIGRLDKDLAKTAREHPVARNATTIFGVGAVIATAVTAKYGSDVSRYADARQFAANLGTTPSEHSSGQSRYLGGITKRGDPYLRRLLVQGAQSVLRHCTRRDDPICLLARELLQRRPRNVVVIAIANRLARILYAVIKHGTPYRYGPTVAA
jgi:transposase